MTATGQVIGAGTAFVWLGMVLAISFLETPLKFRAPGITLPLGLGIGRLVFRALNTTEITLAAVLLAALLTSPARGRRLGPARHHRSTAGHPDRAAAATTGPTRPADHHRPDPTPIPAAPGLHRPGILKVAALIALGTLLITSP